MEDITRLLHDIAPDELTGAISTPVYQSSTYVQEAPGLNRGFDYTRTNNPTRQALERLVANLEHGYAGFAFASGLAACDAVVKLLSAGDEIVAVDDIYGGSFRLFEHIYKKLGITINYVDTTDIAAVADAVTEKTQLIWVESPTNPTLKISDIETLASIAKANSSWLVVDNTFASPALQQPILLGADIVIHSATKYLAGHSDVLAGLVVVKDDILADRLKFIQNASGGVLAPWDSWLTIRGIQTLHLRIERQSDTALEIARYLETHPAVDRVFYPGLKSHVNHEVAKKQQKKFGGVVSFSLKDDTQDAAKAVVTGTRFFKLAESLGGVKSLICHPATMTHKSTPAEVRQRAGIQDSLVRLSVGIEDAADLVKDLEAVLGSIEAKAKLQEKALTI